MVTIVWCDQNSLLKIGSSQALDMLGSEQDPSWFRHDHLPYKIWFSQGPQKSTEVPTKIWFNQGPQKSPESTDEEIKNVPPGSLSFIWWAFVYSSHCPPVSFPIPSFAGPHPPLLPTPAACAGLVLFLKTWTPFLPVNWVISSLVVTSNVLYCSTLVILQETFLNNRSNDTHKEITSPPWNTIPTTGNRSPPHLLAPCVAEPRILELVTISYLSLFFPIPKVLTRLPNTVFLLTLNYLFWSSCGKRIQR